MDPFKVLMAIRLFFQSARMIDNAAEEFKSTEDPDGWYTLFRALAHKMNQEVVKPAAKEFKDEWRAMKQKEALMEWKWIEVPRHKRYELYRQLGALSCSSVMFLLIASANRWLPAEALLFWWVPFVVGFILLFKSLKYKGGHTRVRVWKGTSQRVWDVKVDNHTS